MSVAASGDVAVIIDFARLVATSGQSQPRADRTRLLEVRQVLDGGRERGCGDRANPWDRHQQLTGLALSCAGDKLPSKLGGAGAHAAPSLKNRQDDTRKLSLTDKQALDIIFELAAFAQGTTSPNVFMSPRIWFESSVVILTSLVRAATSVRISMLS